MYGLTLKFVWKVFLGALFGLNVVFAMDGEVLNAGVAAFMLYMLIAEGRE